MGCTKAKRRRQEKISTVAGVVPTVPTVADHCTEGWLATDIYKGEIFINTADNKAYTRGNAGIFEITSSAAAGVETVTGNIVDNTDPANPIIESRVLDVNTTTAGTPASTDPTTLANFTLLANTLSADEDFIDIDIFGTGDLSGGAHLHFNFGTNNVVEIEATGFVEWRFSIKIIRLSNTTLKISYSYFDIGVLTAIAAITGGGITNTGAEDFSINIPITLTAHNDGATVNALVFQSWTITKN